jgi:Uma2 family endonuclease
MRVRDYLRMAETNRPLELVYGVLREPPAPFYGHQAMVTRMAAALHRFVDRHALGAVCVAPVDVVLDHDGALVVQPDIIFVSNARSAILSDRVWGAPDLTVEVLSPGTAKRDRTNKLEWYREYGVRECWLVDPVVPTVEVVCLDPWRPGRIYGGSARFYSRLLPGFRPSITRLCRRSGKNAGVMTTARG